MLTIASHKEKEAIKAIVADLIATCLWYPGVYEARGETDEHEIRAWRDDGVVRAEVKRKG